MEICFFQICNPHEGFGLLSSFGSTKSKGGTWDGPPGLDILELYKTHISGDEDAIAAIPCCFFFFVFFPRSLSMKASTWDGPGKSSQE